MTFIVIVLNSHFVTFSVTTSKAFFSEIKDIKFYVNSAVEGFSPTQKLSDLLLVLESKTFVRLEKLIYFDPKILSSPSEVESEKRCSEMLLSVIENNVTVDTNHDLEKHLVLELMGKVMQHLSVGCSIEIKHKSLMAAMVEESSELETVAVQPLGIGSKEYGKQTWYGSPDGRTRGVPPVPGNNFSDVNIFGIDQPMPETDSCSSNVEFKLRLKLLSQMVGIAVVGAFTEHNLHPQQNPLIPTLVINSSTVMIVLYDCKNDILLISEKVDLFSDDGPHNKVKKSVLLFIWLFINHRSVSCLKVGESPH